MRGLSLVATSRGPSSLRCLGFSLRWLLLLQSTGSRRTGFSSFVTQAQESWRTGLAAPWHVGSSWTRARTHVPCIGRQILNHCTTREVPMLSYLQFLFYTLWSCLLDLAFKKYLSFFCIHKKENTGKTNCFKIFLSCLHIQSPSLRNPCLTQSPVTAYSLNVILCTIKGTGHAAFLKRIRKYWELLGLDSLLAYFWFLF